MNAKKVLITGANGFVGSNLSEALSGDFRLFGLDIAGPGKYPAEDFFSWNQLDSLPAVDTIIHLAGKAHDTSKTSREQEYFDINLGLTKKIFDHFLQSQSVKFIFFSSVKAVADTVRGEWLTEEDEPDPHTPYGRSKLAAERYIMERLRDEVTERRRDAETERQTENENSEQHRRCCGIVTERSLPSLSAGCTMNTPNYVERLDRGNEGDEVTQRRRDSETQRLRDGETQRRRDSETQRLRDSETQRLRDGGTKERVLLAPCSKLVYIIRPAMIHGPGNKGNLNLLYKLASKGIPWPLGSYHNQRSFASIGNVAFVVRQLIEKEVPPGTYNLADDEAVSTNEIIALIANSMGHKYRIWHIPRKLIRAAATTGDTLHLPLNSERLKKLTENYCVSNRLLKNALGIQTMPVGAKEGLQKTFESFHINTKPR